jgi:hypothetical protein
MQREEEQDCSFLHQQIKHRAVAPLVVLIEEEETLNGSWQWSWWRPQQQRATLSNLQENKS